jgi:pentatricopeptide repeat protein
MMGSLMSLQTPTQNFRRSHRKSLGEAVYDALIAACGPTLKHVSRETKITTRTLANWRDGRCDPTAEHLAACARFDAVWAVMREHFGRANDISEAERLLEEMHARLVRARTKQGSDAGHTTFGDPSPD